MASPAVTANESMLKAHKKQSSRYGTQTEAKASTQAGTKSRVHSSTAKDTEGLSRPTFNRSNSIQTLPLTGLTKARNTRNDDLSSYLKDTEREIKMRQTLIDQ